MIDLAEYRVVDSHCHAFLPEKETQSFEQYLTLTDLSIPRIDVTNTFIYRQVVRELSRVLGFTGKHEEIIDERHQRYQQDRSGYIKLLFEDAKIDTLLVDTGYPNEIFSHYTIDLNTFTEFVPSRVKEIFRIELLFYDALKNQLSFNDAIEHFHKQTRKAVENGAIGLKSVIAYRTGLEIQKKPEDEVRNVYTEFIADAKRSGKSIRKILSRSNQVKTIYDYFVFLSVDASVELEVPLQMHVGLGEAPFDLRLANPLLLHELINDESANNAKIILTHGGYPYLEEAGFLVNAYPNVYLDLSETIPFISIGIKEKLLNLFEMAPITKIMYGSDGYCIPELYWISSIQTKKALLEALTELLEAKQIDEEWAYEIARNFLSENAKRIYKL